MIILDSLLIGGIRFVLDKIATAVDAELNDETALRDELLAAQMRLELGELTDGQFRVIEVDVLARLREVRDRRQGAGTASLSGDYRITGVDATVEGDEHS
ncbi:MAG TPA: gas vesicle protein GvpG [Vicinamibacterales bacterium]|nr:gas vesicle protein GvpG [Vicinamibacterales bacterium]